MQDSAREYLIAVARQKTFVSYSDFIDDNRLKFDLETPAGRQQLKEILESISKEEHSNGRPMLTAVVVKKGTTDQGNGFYELAERLDYGKLKDLQASGWGIIEMQKVWAYWENETNFARYGSRSVQTETNIEKLFRRLMDPASEYQKEWADEYIFFTDQVEILRAALLTTQGLSITDDSLYTGLHTSLQSYESFMNRWLLVFANGISSKGQSLLSEKNFNIIIRDVAFQTIAQLVISKPSLQSYNLLDQWWYDNQNGYRPLLINRAIAACLPGNISSVVDRRKFWAVINILKQDYGFTFTNDPKGNWFEANVQLTQWLDNQLHLPLHRLSNDSKERWIWRNIFAWLIYARLNSDDLAPGELRKSDPPKGYSDFPARDPSFEGNDVDFMGQARRQKELGNAGELLVKDFERRSLEQHGLFDLASKVRIEKDGKGYDVLSYDKNGHEKFIEVKTTSGAANKPFFLTRHELKFMRAHKEQYSLYRLYHFNEENGSSEYFELHGNTEESILLDATAFEVVMKAI